MFARTGQLRTARDWDAVQRLWHASIAMRGEEFVRRIDGSGRSRSYQIKLLPSMMSGGVPKIVLKLHRTNIVVYVRPEVGSNEQIIEVNNGGWGSSQQTRTFLKNYLPPVLWKASRMLGRFTAVVNASEKKVRFMCGQEEMCGTTTAFHAPGAFEVVRKKMMKYCDRVREVHQASGWPVYQNEDTVDGVVLAERQKVLVTMLHEIAGEWSRDGLIPVSGHALSRFGSLGSKAYTEWRSDVRAMIYFEAKQFEHEGKDWFVRTEVKPRCPYDAALESEWEYEFMEG